MKVIFGRPTFGRSAEDYEDLLTVIVSGDPENVTLEFVDQKGDQAGLIKLILNDESRHARLADELPESKGRFNASKLEHWKLIELVFRSPYLNARIAEE